MIATHALTVNGSINTELKDAFGPEDQEIRRRVGLLDGKDRYSLILWALPPDVALDSVDLDTWPQEYIQCAGSQHTMTVEIREIAGGEPRQYVIGRRTDADDNPPEQVIAWGGIETKVRASEVFDAKEAAELFVFYYHSGTCPDGYVRRQLAL